MGISRYFSVPVTALIVWYLVVKGTPKRVEQVFLLMSLIFLIYIVSAFLAKPDWLQVGTQFIKPSFSFESGYLFTVVALIGTTITPFMQIFVQSSVVEKGLDKSDTKWRGLMQLSEFYLLMSLPHLSSLLPPPRFIFKV